MQRILVTGGTGFLGSHAVKRLADMSEIEYIVIPTTKIRSKTSLDILNICSDKLRLINGDIRDYDFVQRVFNEYEFDTLLHLGALSEVRKCQSNAKLAYDTNIGGTVNLLEAARLFGDLKAIVVSSSDKAYGRCDLPYTEDDPLDGKGVYEASKSCQDLIARSYFYNYGLPVAVIRCANIYGGADVNFSRIVPNTIRLILNGEPPMIWAGAENFIREFLYVEDAADACLAIIKNIEVAQGNAYNVGSGENITIGELVAKILEKFPTELKIEYRERSFPEINNQYTDSSKIKRDVGWFAKTSLDEGLNKTIAQYKRTHALSSEASRVL